MAKRKPGARSPKRTRRKSVRAAPTVPVTLVVRRIVAIDWFRRFTRHRAEATPWTNAAHGLSSDRTPSAVGSS